MGQQERETVFTLAHGDRAAFVLGWGEEAPRPADADVLLAEAAEWWRRWTRTVEYEGLFRVAVERDAITLKLLTYAPTGAVVAAPTTSLPEIVGGDANWDYRYTWLRDATLALYALLATGQRAEGDAFFDWICARIGEEDVARAGLRIMYDVDGGSDHSERTLSFLEGYRGSRPVRVGNAACTQVQIDVYGEVLDAFSTSCAWGRSEKLELWEDYRPLADWVCVHWQRPDNGIWELRAEERHYVHSKLLAWVALDRAIRTAVEHRLAGDLGLWRKNERLLSEWILAHGWSDELGAFRRSAGEERLDVTNLLVPMVGFLPPDDPRVRSNLERTRAELATGEPELLYRFRAHGDDRHHEGEGAFLLGSFWLVNALAADGRAEEAVALFERLTTRASPLGLYAEEIDPASGELLGNMPQAFVHAGALSAAVNLARAAGVGSAPASGHAPAGTAHLAPAR